MIDRARLALLANSVDRSLYDLPLNSSPEVKVALGLGTAMMIMKRRKVKERTF